MTVTKKKSAVSKKVVKKNNSSTSEEFQITQLRDEVSNLKKEAEDREWGIQKTNEGIKILYRELEKKNKELEKLDQLKSEFVSTVSHELRTPITIIKESISQILEGFCGNVTDGQTKLLSMALKNIERLGRIINNLLDVAKLEDGKIILQKEEVNLVELVQEVNEGFRPQAKKLGLDIKQEFSEENFNVEADRDKVIQILTNLIGNAMKFTEQGSITTKLLRRNASIECSVCDTGKGMTQDQLLKVFDKFQQFGRKSGAGEKGTGLGLAITKGFVELHQGSIWVESEEGVGTKFIFTLPCGGST